MARAGSVTRECLRLLGRVEEPDETMAWFASGTAALSAALTAASACRGAAARYVVVPACVCPQVYLAVIDAGLEPVFVTSDPTRGYVLQLEALRALPVASVAAFVWVHQYGAVTQTDEVRAWCARCAWPLIEDAALAFGARVDGGAAGTLGDCAVLSFGVGKVVSLGYGGALVFGSSPTGLALRDAVAGRRAAPRGTAPRTRVAAGAALEMFDRALKRACNDDYATLRTGRLADRFQPLLARCVPLAHAPDMARLERELSPRLRLASRAVALRNARAARWRERLAEHPTLQVIAHPAGTYWRLNVLCDPESRRRLLAAGLARQLPLSSWYPPLYWLVRARVAGTRTHERRFADRVLNLWVSGVAWEAYFAAVMRLFDEDRGADESPRGATRPPSRRSSHEGRHGTAHTNRGRARR